MKWLSITNRTKYVDVHQSLVSIYYLSEKSVVLIDSGGDECPDLFSDLEQQGLTVRAVLCTHLHQDHTANLYEIIDKYKPDVFASKHELSASYYDDYYGEKPLTVIPLDTEQEINIDGERFEILPTYGHSEGHLAFVTPDGICCLGDVLLTEDILLRSKIPYMADVNQAMISMEQVRQMNYPYYLLSHKGVVQQPLLRRLVDMNIQKELELYDVLRRQVREPIHIDKLTDKFMSAVMIQNQAIFCNKAYRQTVQSRIAGLLAAGEVEIHDGIVYLMKPN